MQTPGPAGSETRSRVTAAEPARAARKRHPAGSAGRRLRWLLLGLCLWLGAAWPAAEPDPLLVGAAGVDGRAVAAHVSYWRDPDGRADLAGFRRALREGRAQRLDAGRALNFGFTDDAVWLHLRLRRGEGVAAAMLLIDYALLGEARVHVPALDGRLARQRGGMDVPPSERAFRERLPVFRVPLPERGVRDVYVRARTAGTLQVPLSVHTPDALAAKLGERGILLGMYYGVFTALALFNLLVFALTRDRNYAYYVIAVIWTGLIALGVNGLGALYVWPGLVAYNAPIINLFVGCSCIAVAQFSRVFLELRTRMPRWDRAVLALMALAGLALATVIPLGQPRHMILMSLSLVLLTIPLLVVVGALALHGGYRPARFYMLGWTLYFVGPLLLAMDVMGVVPSSVFTRYGTQMGSSLEMILFSLALGDRLRWLRDETARMLEAKVSERTDQLDTALAELSASNRMLRRLSRQDPLTGAQNRRGLEEAMAEAWRTASADGSTVSLLMLDIDHFKRLNDAHGHACGDAVLGQLARSVMACVRGDTDTVARYGGEEFVVLLPQLGSGRALALAERIRRTVASTPVYHGELELHVTVSVGVATTDTGAPEGMVALTEAADASLYTAKQQGRNRTAGVE